MQLGTGVFTAGAHPSGTQLASQRHEAVVDLAGIIEDAGLDSAWVTEGHSQGEELVSSSLPVLGAMAAVTDSVELGSVGLPGTLYQPVRLAEDAATVDLLGGGRLTVGLANAWNPGEDEVAGISTEERPESLAAFLERLRAAWSGGSLGTDRDSQESDASVSPAPEMGSVPLVLGGTSEAAIRRAANHADGWVAPPDLSLEAVQSRVEEIRSIRGGEGQFRIYVRQHGWVGDSRIQAWEAMQDGYLYRKRQVADTSGGDAGRHFDGTQKRELKERAIFGTPEQVGDQLQSYRDVLGDDIHFILEVAYPGVDTVKTAACIERLGEHVAPRVRKLQL